MSDIAWTGMDTDAGTFTVAASARGLVLVALPGDDRRDTLALLRQAGTPREDPAGVADYTAVLEAYLSGDRRDLDVPLDWALVPAGFRREALEALHRVPYGEVVSYAELAALAGRPRAVRAAGTACATNPIPVVIPCHRVVRSDGMLGNYGGGVPLKARLLRLEGVEVTGDPPRVAATAVR
ncbi:MAG: methylated-DNA--[protein]-cysteine S-methyltransferase [Thermoleophilia bacterium]